MKIKWAQILTVSAFVTGATVLFCTWGCNSEPKPTAENNMQMKGTQAPAPLAGTTEGAGAASETPPAAQPKESVKAEATPAADARQAPTIYVVRRGDTLSSISLKYYGTRANWKLILDANANVVKAPKDLKPDMKLVIPAAKAGASASSAGGTPSP